MTQVVRCDSASRRLAV